MIKIENTYDDGWEAAIRGMRNPLESWDKSDSVDSWGFIVGENDLKLMKKLSKAGSDHSKYLRMINVTCDITAPLYWWKEFDTYKVGTVANSCSTMHTIHKKEFTLDDFSGEYLLNNRDSINRYIKNCDPITPYNMLHIIVDELNWCRNKYLETKDKTYWWQMIQLLPSSYNQKRTVQMNYQVLKNMYHTRKNHKLDCWRDFCEWCETLPYFKEICVEVE